MPPIYTLSFFLFLLSFPVSHAALFGFYFWQHEDNNRARSSLTNETSQPTSQPTKQTNERMLDTLLHDMHECF